MQKPEPTKVESVNQEVADFDRFFQSLQPDNSSMLPPEKALITTYLVWVQEGRPPARQSLGKAVAR